MTGLWKLTLFFLLCLVIALLVNLPMQQVLPHVKLPATVRLAGIDGTILNGTAQEVVVNNFPLRSVNYRYLPSCLPLLKLCYGITYEKGDFRVAYDLLNGDTEVSEALIEYRASELVQYLPNAPVKPAGRVQLKIDELTMLEGRMTTVNGKLIWRNLGLDDENVKVDLGDYQLDFVGDQAKYDFKINDLDASLDVSGKAEIKPDGQYSLDVRVGSENGIDPNVKSVLNLLANKTAHDKYRVQQKGRLSPAMTQQLFR
jgi:general secretion pathway protein N